MKLAFSQACENNKSAILIILKNAFKQVENVLEIGSGTGQHASYFAENLPHLNWQTSDLLINHPSITERVVQAGLTNLFKPLTVDLNSAWPSITKSQLNTQQVDAIFTANTLHIVSWPLVEKFFQEISKHLSTQGCLCIYGPFNYQGKFTSESNADFDLWLKDRDKNSGIRDFEEVVKLAKVAGIRLIKDHQMPANNRLLEFTMESVSTLR